MAVLLVLTAAAAFGAGDQYLGSIAIPWTTELSLLSAPSLLVGFLSGWTQPNGRRALVVGLAATATAFAAYGLMTISPIEGAHLTLRSAVGFVSSERRNLIGGILTGPLFGLFGYLWRTRRSLPGALALAAAVCLEPLAHAVSGETNRFRAVSIGEIVAGVLLAGYFATRMRLGRRLAGGG